MNDNFIPAFIPFALEKARYKFADGGRGGGKSMAFADIFIAQSLERKMNHLCARQIQNSLSESVYSLLQRRIEKQKVESRFKLTQAGIWVDNGSKFMFRGLKDDVSTDAVKSIDEIERAWLEEAQNITQDALDKLYPSIRADNAEIWASYNRRANNDPIHLKRVALTESETRCKYIDDHGREYHWTEYRGKDMIGISINYDGNPFFPEALEIERLNCKRDQPDEYPHIWDGEPKSKELLAVIARSAVKDAMKRQTALDGGFAVGVDVAREGDDSTVITKRKGFLVYPQQCFKGNSIPETFRRTIDIVNMDKTIPIKVDDTGVGGGVTDLLEEAGYNVFGVNNNQVAKAQNKYPSAIDEMWFELAGLMSELKLPYDLQLEDELSQRLRGIDSRERRFVESKKEYKKRYKKSPDKADSILLCFYQPIKPVFNAPIISF